MRRLQGWTVILTASFILGVNYREFPRLARSAELNQLGDVHEDQNDGVSTTSDTAMPSVQMSSVEEPSLALPQPPSLHGDSSMATTPLLKSTPFSGFRSAVASSFTLTAVTEFGDRTFFIAAMMAFKNSKVPVLLGATSALLLQTLFSIFIGRILHYLPNSSTQFLRHVPLDDYAAAILLFVFAVVHLKAAKDADVKDFDVQESDEFIEAKETVDRVQYMQLGSRASWSSVVKETFVVVFIAELGDKSMISTIALATAQSPVGVLLGALMAHFLLTSGAVFSGSLLQNYISETGANLASGLLFLLFSILTLLEGLARQGILPVSRMVKVLNVAAPSISPFSSQNAAHTIPWRSLLVGSI